MMVTRRWVTMVDRKVGRFEIHLQDSKRRAGTCTNVGQRYIDGKGQYNLCLIPEPLHMVIQLGLNHSRNSLCGTVEGMG